LRRLVLAALLVASPALAEDRPDIDRAWQIARATALDFSSTAEGYQARIWDGQTQGGWLYRSLFPELVDPAFLSLSAARDTGEGVSSLDCTRIGPQGLALMRAGGRFEGFSDVDANGTGSAPDLPEDDDTLRLLGGLARRHGAEGGIFMQCTLSQPIDTTDGAIDYLVTRLAPDFETKAPSLFQAQFQGGKPGPQGQILTLDVGVVPGPIGEKPAMMFYMISRSGPGS